ncbi:MAG: RNA polymerase sigma factor [Comamonadaceae bacterium]|nr:RNA polymerase sigma factor [Comamonadaceae bacterium]
MSLERNHDVDGVDAEVLFRDLVKEHWTRLHRFIIKNIGNHDDAEDLTQQAFSEAVRSFERFRGESELSTWLYGIAMNLVRNHLSRAPSRRYEFTDDSELEFTPSDELDPAAQLEQTQQLTELAQALEDLPPRMREVLLMVAVDELSYEEAAVLLTVPVGTVRSRLSRARTALRAQLEGRGVDLDFLK